MASGFVQFLEVGRLDEVARLDSPVHRLDARAQIAVGIAFIVTVMSFPRYEVSALMPLALYPVALVAVADLPLSLLLRKLAVAAPFALLVGIANPVLDRTVVATIGDTPVTGGWLSFISLLVRFVLTVGAALILVSCTGMHRLCAGLERLGMPGILAVQLLFLHRYFFVIGDEGLRMRRSVAIRSAGSRAPGIRLYGHLAGTLLVRAIDRAQRIYQSMRARGFNGQIRVLRTEAWGWRETAFVTGWLAFFVAARMWNMAVWMGGS